MSHPLATRIYLGLATILFVSGFTLGAAGLHPAINRPNVTRFGFLLALASMPPWMVVMSRHARQLTEAQLRDAHLSGYQTCLEQLREQPELRQQLLYKIPAPRMPYARKRGV